MFLFSTVVLGHRASRGSELTVPLGRTSRLSHTPAPSLVLERTFHSRTIASLTRDMNRVSATVQWMRGGSAYSVHGWRILFHRSRRCRRNRLYHIGGRILDGAKTKLWKKVRLFTTHELFRFAHHRAPQPLGRYRPARTQEPKPEPEVREQGVRSSENSRSAVS